MVRFPLYSPNECDNAYSIVKERNLHHDDSFIGDDTIVEMIDLLSVYVYFNGKKYVDFSDIIFVSIPANIVEFAYYSRIDSGYRLLE